MNSLKLPEGYVRRGDVPQFDDTGLEDQWQNEVYLFALGVGEAGDLNTVIDIGCGSAHKLVKYFGSQELIGVENNPKTLEWLKEKFDSGPFENYLWFSPEEFKLFNDYHTSQVAGDFSDDLLCICSDVIEHVEEPGLFFSDLLEVPWHDLILSTPVRHAHEDQGPPGSEYHVQEWSFEEFKEFVQQWDGIQIKTHCIINPEQRTQMMWVTRA